MNELVPMTDRASRVLELAQAVAQEWRHATVEPHHLLVALAQEDLGLAACALKNCGTNADLIASTASSVHSVDPRACGTAPVPSESLNQLQFKAAEEARHLKHYYVGTEHLLLAITHEDSECCNQLFRLLGLDPREVRSEVLQILGHFE